VAAATVPVATQRLSAVQIEQNADELVQSLRTAAEHAWQQGRTKLPGLRLVAAGLAVQRSTIVCCSRVDGSALTPAISWQDRRNAAWLETLGRHAGRVRELTGLPLAPHYGASKIRWCLEHLPAVARAAATDQLLAAPLASFLALNLCRQDAAPLSAARVDAANAARTLLFDPERLDWSDELLQLFAIRRAWLPHCAPTRGAWGTVRLPGTAVELSAVTGDQSAVPFAIGPPDSAIVYVNLGTGAFIQRPLAARPRAPAPLLGSVLLGEPGGAVYSLEGTVNGAGSAVSWFCAAEHCTEQELWPALEALPAHTALPVFLNGVGGLGSPWWRAELEPRFIDAPQAAGTLLRFAAVIESIAFMIAANAALLVQQAGPAQRVLLAGGMSRSPWLARRLAALLAVPVSAADAEASARGVARLAAPQLAASWHSAPLMDWPPHPDAALHSRYQRFLDAIAKA